MKKKNCTGCGACVNACPNNALEMVLNKDGFYYPKKNSNCNECGLCDLICDYSLENKSGIDQKVYACWSNDNNVRMKSTSGGIFFELAHSVIDAGGTVFGASYINPYIVQHTKVSSVDELNSLLKSKYVQSDIGKSFREVETLLKKEEIVLFCGCPCQIGGLKKYLRQDYDNLYTVDFVCRGIPSPFAYEKWLTEMSDEGEIAQVEFKYKNNGWKKSPYSIKIEYVSGRVKELTEKNNDFMKAFLKKDLITRYSCEECEYKGDNHKSDIMLGDFWKIDTKYDDDRGTSIVVVNSDKGKNLFEKIKNNISVFEKDQSDIEKGNRYYNSCVSVNENSIEFMLELNKYPFSEVYKKIDI